MPGLHVDPAEDRASSGHGGAQPGDPLGGLPIGDARIGQAAERKDRRIGLGGDVVVGRVGQDRLERRLALGRIAPFGPFRRGERQVRVEHRVEHVDEGYVGDDAGEQLRREVRGRAHQHAAMGDDAALPRIARLDQRPAAGDEVGEGVGLLLALALEIPVPTLLGAAADMGDGVDEAAIDEAEQVGAEPRRHQRAVGAVAVEQQRRRAVEGESAAMQERDRNAFPVRRGREQATGDVVGGLVAARHGLALAQDAGAGDAVVIVGLGRRRHRRVGEADACRLELVAGQQAERVGFLREGDGVLLALHVAHDDARQGVLQFEPHEVVAEHVQVPDHHAGAVGHRVAPVLPRRRVEGTGDDLEVHRAVGIRQNDEIRAPVLDRVDQPLLAACDATERALVVGPVEQVDFRRLVVARRDGEISAGLGAADIHEEARIGFLVDDRVLRLIRAEAVAHDAGRTVVLVEGNVEEGGAGGVPHRVARGRFDPLRAVLAGVEVAHADGVEFRTLGVDAPGQKAVVVGMGRAGDLEEGEALALLIAVEQDLLADLAVLGLLGDAVNGARPAADQRMLATLAMAGVVSERPIGLGHRGVVLADASAHLGDQGLAQGGGAAQRRLGIGVLGVEIGADVGGERRGVLQHGPPVLGLEPREGILDAPAEEFEGVRTFLRLGRRGRQSEGRGLEGHRRTPVGTRWNAWNKRV